jgi:hypothetical protein
VTARGKRHREALALGADRRARRAGQRLGRGLAPQRLVDAGEDRRRVRLAQRERAHGAAHDPVSTAAAVPLPQMSPIATSQLGVSSSTTS